MKNPFSELQSYIELKKLSLIKLVIASLALGSITAFVTSTGGVILALAGILLITIEIYNAVIDVKEEKEASET